jgi:hypothetical protein
MKIDEIHTSEKSFFLSLFPGKEKERKKILIASINGAPL